MQPSRKLFIRVPNGAMGGKQRAMAVAVEYPDPGKREPEAKDGISCENQEIQFDIGLMSRARLSLSSGIAGHLLTKS